MLVPVPDLPGLFAGVDWICDFAQQGNRSEFTRKVWVVGTPGPDQWLATGKIAPNATPAEVRAWRAFLISCEGRVNTFHLPAPKPWPTPSANPTVAAEIAGGVTVSSAAEVKVGNYATVEQANGHFRLILIAGVDGNDVLFGPALTGAPKIGAPFEIIEPFSPMRRPDNRVVLPERAVPEGFTFDAEEAF